MLVTISLLIQNTVHTQLLGEDLYFGSIFVQVAVHSALAPKKNGGVAEEFGRGTTAHATVPTFQR